MWTGFYKTKIYDCVNRACRPKRRWHKGADRCKLCHDSISCSAHPSALQGRLLISCSWLSAITYLPPIKVNYLWALTQWRDWPAVCSLPLIWLILVLASDYTWLAPQSPAALHPFTFHQCLSCLALILQRQYCSMSVGGYPVRRGDRRSGKEKHFMYCFTYNVTWGGGAHPLCWIPSDAW